jgi:hypothetical protein
MTAEDMICLLASRCDGATAIDGQGFNRYDADFGRSLADYAHKGLTWTPAQAAGALKLIRKYQNQLGCENISTWLDNPSFRNGPTGKDSKKKPTNKLESKDTNAIFTFDYDSAIVSDIKSIRGTHKGQRYWAAWDQSSKTWSVPVTSTSIFQIMHVAEKHNFEIEQRFITYYDKVLERTEESRTMLSLNGNRHIVLSGDTILINISDLEILAEFQNELKDKQNV